MNFADNLLNEIEKKQNPSVVGLDPRLKQIPEEIKQEAINKFGKTPEAAANSFLVFNKKIIDAVKDIVPAVKPQVAFYEQYQHHGIKAFEETIRYAQSKGLLVIGDCKRNDIGSTAQAYSNAFLGKTDLFRDKSKAFDVDCLTINPYLGIDGIQPFIDDIKEYGKGVFVLVKTSNPSSGEFQDLFTEDKKRMYEIIGKLVNKWNQDTIGERGYGSVGAVVGATYPQQAVELRTIMEKSIFLVPGYGAQGGGADDTIPCFNKDGFGAIVNSSRGIIFAYEKNNKEFDIAAQEAAIQMKDDINTSLKKANILPW